MEKLRPSVHVTIPEDFARSQLQHRFDSFHLNQAQSRQRDRQASVGISPRGTTGSVSTHNSILSTFPHVGTRRPSERSLRLRSDPPWSGAGNPDAHETRRHRKTSEARLALEGRAAAYEGRWSIAGRLSFPFRWEGHWSHVLESRCSEVSPLTETAESPTSEVDYRPQRQISRLERPHDPQAYYDDHVYEYDDRSDGYSTEDLARYSARDLNQHEADQIRMHDLDSDAPYSGVLETLEGLRMEARVTEPPLTPGRVWSSV